MAPPDAVRHYEGIKMKQTIFITFAALCCGLFLIGMGSAKPSEHAAESQPSIADVKAAIAELQMKVTELGTDIDETRDPINKAPQVPVRSVSGEAEQHVDDNPANPGLQQLSEAVAQYRDSVDRTMLVVNKMQEWIVQHEEAHQSIQQSIDDDEELNNENSESHIAITKYIDDVRTNLKQVRDYVEYYHPQK